MKKAKTKKTSKRRKKRKRLNPPYLICWAIIPIIIMVALVLDGLGLYRFTSERLLVIGAGVIVMLVPFFNEIKVKDVSLKKENSNSR